MKKSMRIGCFLGLCFLCFGKATLAQSSSCSDKIDQSLCNKLSQLDDTAWVGCMVELKRQPIDSQVTDPSKDTSTNHDTGTYSPPAYLVAAKDSLFTMYELRWPDTIGYLPAPYPAKTRASVPTVTESFYGVFATKMDILSIGNEAYILMVSSWSPGVPASSFPLLKEKLKTPGHSLFFNLNGQCMIGSRHQSGPSLIFKK